MSALNSFPTQKIFKSVGETSNSIEIEVDGSPSIDNFIQFIRWLPMGFSLTFYDQYYPSQSDPGAYIEILRCRDYCLYKAGNHGWSSDWIKQSIELTAAWLTLNLKKKGTHSEILKKFKIEEAIHLPNDYSENA